MRKCRRTEFRRHEFQRRAHVLGDSLKLAERVYGRRGEFRDRVALYPSPAARLLRWRSRHDISPWSQRGVQRPVGVQVDHITSASDLSVGVIAQIEASDSNGSRRTTACDAPVAIDPVFYYFAR